MRAVLASVFGDVAFMGFQHGLVGVQEVIQAEDFQRNKGGEMKVPHGVQNGVQRSGRHVVQGFVFPFFQPVQVAHAYVRQPERQKFFRPQAFFPDMAYVKAT